MTSQEMKNLTEWINDQIQSHAFGEIHITLKLHEGRPTLLETSVIERTQLTGKTGGLYEKRNR